MSEGTCDYEESRPHSREKIDEVELTLHKVYRERVVQEDNLINHRMTWMILSQAFLFGLWAALYQKTSIPDQNNLIQATPELKVLLFTIACVGLGFAWGSGRSINAAQVEIENIKTRFLWLYPQQDFRFPGIIASERLHNLGHTIPNWMPFILRILWTVLLIYMLKALFHLF